jgi:hypothetical protein
VCGRIVYVGCFWIVNGIYRSQLAWTEAKHRLDQICAELNLKWSYAPESYTVVFRRQDGIEHDLETCFGSAEYHVSKDQVMWGIGFYRIVESLRGWLGK